MPSFADDIAAIGAAASVVAVSQFTKGHAFDTLPRVADFQSVDAERIVALHPTVVFGIPSQARYVEPLRHAGVNVELIADDTFSDLFNDIEVLSRATGTASAGSALERRLRAETQQLRSRAAAFKRHPTVFIVLGTGPIWSAGPHTYIGTLIDYAGGRDAATALGGGWGQFSAEALLALQPDVLISGPDTHLKDVLARPPWNALHAVRDGHVFVLDDTDILYRPGPRYNEGLRWLIDRLTPLSK